ncbi:MAG TPA: hypothetical protein VMK66_08395 [Myxococcales bacterium]|nr:hypothetical protein [Myxococcales bacterium]
MRRLSLKQILVAIAVGALFATLQGDPPLAALKGISSAACNLRRTGC